ncbi:MAG: hypothetical protein HXY44_05140 [Syntrophaceae bacterium]|nr:hypothetical protein [Syntrophaceae bacterium]
MVTKEFRIGKTYFSENLPPAFAEAASRRQVTPLCQRGETLVASLRAESLRPPFRKGRIGGI